MRRSISLKEIARLAGVSHPTVSRALRDSPLISELTKKRIQQIASERGYQPNMNARGLVTRQNNMVGCVVSDVADPFVGEVIAGLERVATENDFSLVLNSCGFDAKREMRAVKSLVERAVDGVLVIAAMSGGKHSPFLMEREIPIVLINNHYPGSYAHSIGIANSDAAEQMTTHLLRLSHRRIAYIGNRRGGEAEKDRHKGYRAALRKAGIPYTPELVRSAESTLEGGHSCMTQLLTVRNRPTAAFCFDDITAYGACKAVRDLGLRVPGDVSVAGFDDLMFSSYYEPPLTTIRQPMRAMGERAMQLLLELIPQMRSSTIPKSAHILLPGELVVRQSTAPVKRNED